ncbi:Kinesin light chain [Fusarium albosuccineum]|uniref:Kinesin light chain n=1 Tax=Fusarium albosuccineum TaxID=1237068 RepID=A0A8H4LJH8_9HYPO|nr:Kinesin light chain [Fusarium albosuccineum]
MAEAVGLAASIIAIVELSAKVGSLCLKYSSGVRNATRDIAILQNAVKDLGMTFQGAQRLLEQSDSQELSTSQELRQSLVECQTELEQLKERLAPGTTRKAMSRFGFRALKWPFDSKDIQEIVTRLERHQRNIASALQIDQTTLLLHIKQGVENLSLQPDEDSKPNRKPCFMVPFEHDPDFVNRTDIMTWLQDQYGGPNSRMALVGMGGFGKSQLAIQFAHHIRETSPETSVFWVHASSESRFKEAYRSIANILRIPRRDDPSTDILALVRDWLQSDEVGPWFMILDNADDVNLFYAVADEGSSGSRSQRLLAPFLPKRHKGTMLVTSRSLSAAGKLTGNHKAIHKISTMNEAQAIQLFRNKIEGDFDESLAAALLHALGYIPLAITQAAAYINHRAPRVSLSRYLEDFQKSDRKKGSLLNSDAGDLRRDETVANSIVITWQVTFEQIRRDNPSAADLLSFMSFFNAQGIPEFVLHDYQNEIKDK